MHFNTIISEINSIAIIVHTSDLVLLIYNFSLIYNLILRCSLVNTFY